MTSFNELVIGSSQGFAFLLKIITEVFQDYVHLQGHGLAMISHKCEPSVSKEFNLFSVVDFYCLCVCHSNSPTVCSALKNGHLLCRIEHFHFLDGILTSLCIFYSLLFTVLSLSWTVCPMVTSKYNDYYRHRQTKTQTVLSSQFTEGSQCPGCFKRQRQKKKTKIGTHKDKDNITKPACTGLLSSGCSQRQRQKQTLRKRDKHLASLQESLILWMLSSPFTSGCVGDGGGRPVLAVLAWEQKK